VSKAVDYDAPRRDRTADDGSRQLIKEIRHDLHSEVIDDDEEDTARQGHLMSDPASRWAGEPTVYVVPAQVGEFTCSRCFLIYRYTLLARTEHGQAVCRNCG